MTALTTPPRSWSKLFTQNAQEFGPTPLTLLTGQIPQGLRGTLYRNGPGTIQRGGQRVGHWFDGDGAILAVHFREDGAKALYRYVKTPSYLAETQADRYLWANYSMTDPQGLWHYWKSMFTKQDILKNAANTSVLAFPDKLLALWEAGLPHALDLETLETLGIENFGQFPPDQPYSAHPLRDPNTGDIYSIGVDIQGNLNLYHQNASGQLLKQKTLKLKDIPFVHSFCLAGPYLIFLLPPLKLDKLAVLFGTKAYASALQWQTGASTRLVVVDRDRFEIVSQGETDPFFLWHYGNGCLDTDGNVCLDFVKFSDFAQTNEFLREMATGRTHTISNGYLWQMRLNPQTGQVLESNPLIQRSSEFPVIDPRLTSQPWRYTYLAIQRHQATPGQEWFGAIARFDHQTGQIVEHDLGENRYVVEPLYIPDGGNPDQGWLITIVYDGQKDQSEVWIWDSQGLADEPLCRLALPQRVPFSFHGTWAPLPPA